MYRDFQISRSLAVVRVAFHWQTFLLICDFFHFFLYQFFFIPLNWTNFFVFEKSQSLPMKLVFFILSALCVSGK